MSDSLEFWCDESSHNQAFMTVGGIAVRSGRYKQISDEVERIRSAYHVPSEIKWSSFGSPHIEGYRAIVSYFFSLLSSNIVHYHVIVFNNATLDKITYPGANHGSVLSRMYYQLGLHRCVRLYGNALPIHMRPDRSNDLKELPQLRAGMNADGFLRYNAFEAVKSIEPRDSAEENILQLNDVILGAIAHHRNGRHDHSTCSEHKRQLAADVLAGMELPNFTGSTPIKGRRFTLWNFVSKQAHQP